MHYFEGRFRQQFVPDGDGYRFREGKQDAHFTQAEVDAFIAQRRRIWSNPIVWTVWLAVGVAAPIWLAATGATGAAFGLGAIALLYLAVLLVSVDRRPHDIAVTRVDPEPPRPAGESWTQSPWYTLATGPLYLSIMVRNFWDPKASLGGRLLFGCVGAIFIVSMVSAAFKLLRRGFRRLPGN
jgi:hypothetical protein